MEKITNIFKKTEENGTRAAVSFEIFPPKGDLTIETAREVVAELTKLEPEFVSVTYSAGGSGNSGATADIAAMLQDEFSTPTVAHLTCAHASKESIAASIEDMKSKGIVNVLALRGDVPEGFQPSKDFRYAKDLIPVLKEAGFCVGAAAYPEGHTTELDLDVSIDYLKQKQDAGADFFVTQLFFDNELAFRFLDKTDAAGINVPITFGIMPFMSKSQVQRMVFMCGSSLPGSIVKLLAKYENDEASLVQAGIEYAANQLIGLEKHGVAGLHLYTMNKPFVAERTIGLLKSARG